MATSSRTSARERLLAAADDLFYTEGIQSVGIDRVIHHAGVAKASLYRSFGGKDDLVAAYLEARHLRNISELRDASNAKPNLIERLLEVFVVRGRWISDENYPGCPFTRASAEAPADSQARAAVDAYRADIRALLRELAVAGKVADPETLVMQLEVLFHGSAVLVTSVPRQRLAQSTYQAAAILIGAAIPATA